MEKPLVGFIGTGVMGKSMAHNLQRAGYELNLYTRSKQKAQDLLNKGCIWCDSVSELAARVDIIMTMVGFPSDVKEVYYGEHGILKNAKAGTIVIDMTTSSPRLAQEIAIDAEKSGLHALDAPVSGGDIGAKTGKLTIMVGGEQEIFKQVKPIFEVLGENVVFQGAAGAGQHTKMCNQMAIASNMIGVCEAVIYAEQAGLDPIKVLKSIETGAAGSWSLSNLAPRMLSGDFAPGFYIKHFIKDMTIALESAEELGIVTPGLRLAKSMYEELAAKGEDESGTQALINWYK